MQVVIQQVWYGQGQEAAFLSHSQTDPGTTLNTMGMARTYGKVFFFPFFKAMKGKKDLEQGNLKVPCCNQLITKMRPIPFISPT